ncbi:hypothetical protein GQ457_05G006110 [Hibiscus cannabinus]
MSKVTLPWLILTAPFCFPLFVGNCARIVAMLNKSAGSMCKFEQMKWSMREANPIRNAELQPALAWQCPLPNVKPNPNSVGVSFLHVSREYGATPQNVNGNALLFLANGLAVPHESDLVVPNLQSLVSIIGFGPEMEKLVVKHRKILSAFLPKAASSAVLSFQVSPPISPVGKGSSSVVSLIPKEAPRKSRNGSFDAREPASPKVSCMGQIKCTKSKSKKKMKKQGGGKSKVASASASASASPPPQATADGEVKRKGAAFIKEAKRGHESNASDSQTKIAEATRVPSLGKMKQFSSARGTLSDFDWRACDAAVGFVPNPLYEEKEGKRETVEETRKIKLWNRRTTKRLTPLRL